MTQTVANVGLPKNLKIIVAAGVVIVILAILAYNYVNTGGSAGYMALDGQAVPQSQLSVLHGIANNLTLANRIGVGAVGLGSFPKNINGTAMKFGGKPGILYIGADFCPYCAVTRWGFILALMRFGNFTQLHYTTSYSQDVYPNTATFSFYNSSYSSLLLGFAHIELTNNTRFPLQTPNASVNVTFRAYSSTGSIPFIDFGNRSILGGSIVLPVPIQNMDWNQIISQLNDTNSTVSQAIIGSADVFTAKICEIDGSAPSSVCSALYVQRIISNGG